LDSFCVSFQSSLPPSSLIFCNQEFFFQSFLRFGVPVHVPPNFRKCSGAEFPFLLLYSFFFLPVFPNYYLSFPCDWVLERCPDLPLFIFYGFSHFILETSSYSTNFPWLDCVLPPPCGLFFCFFFWIIGLPVLMVLSLSPTRCQVDKQFLPPASPDVSFVCADTFP